MLDHLYATHHYHPGGNGGRRCNAGCDGIGVRGDWMGGDSRLSPPITIFTWIVTASYIHTGGLTRLGSSLP